MRRPLFLIVVVLGVLATGCPPSQPGGGSTTTAPTSTSTTLPVDPTLDPAVLEPGVAASTYDAASFIFTGPDAVQVDVEPGAIEPKQAALTRGRALGRDGEPILGVTISVPDAPELGHTTTRAGGWFDFVLNGGTTAIIEYSKPGFLPAQRHVVVSWQDTNVLEDVVLVAVDPAATEVDLDAIPDGEFDVAEGSQVTDADGTRTPILMVPSGTDAELVLPNGTTQPVSSLTIRMTEYTQGASGPLAMPAALPPSVAYTYAVEFSADEALDAGAASVQFSKPLVHYVDNFLDFPAGTTVPVGVYNPETGVWEPSNNGVVIDVVSESAGIANLDVTGDGAADGQTILDAFGITASDRSAIADQYGPGDSVWRAPIPHFSIYDLNHAQALVAQLSPNLPGNPNDDQPEPPETTTSCEGGSAVLCERQALTETLPLVGTPYALHYQSDRSVADYTYEFPISGSTVPATLKRIEVTVEVAGRKFEQTYPATPNQTHQFVWDGIDAYGRALPGSQPIRATVGFVYDGSYRAITQANQFGSFGTTTLVGNPTRQEVTLAQTLRGRIGSLVPAPLGAAGWTIAEQHHYDPQSRTVTLGGGGELGTDPSADRVAEVVAGAGPRATSSGTGPALDATLNAASDIVSDGAGGFYFTDQGSFTVRHVSSEGVISTIAGVAGSSGTSGDGGPATAALLSQPMGIARDLDGQLFVTDARKVRKIVPGGAISTLTELALTPATSMPSDVAVDDHGSVFVSDPRGHKVLRIAPGGAIERIAGNVSGIGTAPTYGGLAAASGVNAPRALTLDGDGNLYFAVTQNVVGTRIVRITTNGIIELVAGTGSGNINDSTFGGDGGPATQARFNGPTGLAFAPDGSLYVADTGNYRVRRISPDRVIETIAGLGTPFGLGLPADYSQNGLPVSRIMLSAPGGIAAEPDGALLLTQARASATTLPNNERILRLAPLLSSFDGEPIRVPSVDGSELYVFDPSGRHLRTIDTFTNAVVRSFTYNPAGDLVGIVDVDGDVTTVERSANGAPTAIVGPFGQRTSLEFDTAKNLTGVEGPAGDEWAMTYSSGRLGSVTNPRGKTSQMTYNSAGQLISDTAADGLSYQLAGSDVPGGRQVVRTSAEGRVTTHRTMIDDVGGVTRVVTAPDGSEDYVTVDADGTTDSERPTGERVSTESSPDQRFGMASPVVNSVLGAPAELELPDREISRSRSVTLTTPRDPLSLSTLTEVTSLDGRNWTAAFDASDRAWTTTSPVGRTETRTLDAKGRISSVSPGGLAGSNVNYDAHGQAVQVTEGSGPTQRTTALAYGTDGWLDSFTNALGQTTTVTHDAAGRPIELSRPDGQSIGHDHDSNGNSTSITPPGKPAHTFTYTDGDLLRTATTPGGDTTTYSYNRDRQATRVDRPDGDDVGYSYDSFGRVSGVELAEGTRTIAYDGNGQVESISAPSGVVVTPAHFGDRSLGETWSGAVQGEVSRSYDGFRISEDTAAGTSIAYGYDADDLLTAAGNQIITRDPLSGLVTRSELGGVVTTFDYNEFAEVVEIKVVSGATEVSKVVYTRDKLGRVMSKVDSMGGVATTVSYTYDLAGRLVTVTTGGQTTTYSYDANGNRLGRTGASGTETGSYGPADRVLSYGGATYVHDAAGDLTSKTSPGGNSSFDYDARGNLLSAQTSSNGTVSYLVDGRDRRVGRAVNGSATHRWLYDGQLKVVAELDGSGALRSRFVYGTRENVPDYMIRGGVTYALVSDELGSVRAVVNVATGVVAQQISYDEFGRVLSDSSPGFQPFGFAGGLYDPATGMVRFGARDYDPQTGRWTTPDPIGFAGDQLNLFAYANGDPINRVDPNGLESSAIDEFWQPRTEYVPADAPGVESLLYINPITGKLDLGLVGPRCNPGSPTEGASQDADQSRRGQEILDYWFGDEKFGPPMKPPPSPSPGIRG